MSPLTEDRMRAYAEEYLGACTEYTHGSERERLTGDWERKVLLADDLVRDFAKRAGNPEGKRVLDVGFGNGLYAAAFARAGAEVHGLEVNKVLADIAKKILAESSISADLRVYDGSTFPFGGNYFDFVYATSVIEHVSDSRRLLAEIARVLKPHGRLYLAFPSRLTPRETHSGLYFLGYLPRSLASYVAHLFGRNTVEELNLHFLSYFTIRRYIRKDRLPLNILFETDSPSLLKRIVKKALAALGIHHSAVLSHVMVILEKRV